MGFFKRFDGRLVLFQLVVRQANELPTVGMIRIFGQDFLKFGNGFVRFLQTIEGLAHQYVSCDGIGVLLQNCAEVFRGAGVIFAF